MPRYACPWIRCDLRRDSDGAVASACEVLVMKSHGPSILLEHLLGESYRRHHEYRARQPYRAPAPKANFERGQVIAMRLTRPREVTDAKNP